MYLPDIAALHNNKLSINTKNSICQWSRRLDSNQCIHPYEGGALAALPLRDKYYYEHSKVPFIIR